MPTQSFDGLLSRLIEQFASAIAERAQEKLSLTARGGGSRARAGGVATRGGPRACTFPGCPNPGNGPRNRWFCKEHAASLPLREQKRILAEKQKSGGSALVLTRRPGPNKGRTSAMKGRKLDMHCRVDGCKNESRGPRFGFICDDHRKKLSAAQQRDAREKWKAAHAKAA